MKHACVLAVRKGTSVRGIDVTLNIQYKENDKEFAKYEVQTVDSKNKHTFT